MRVHWNSVYGGSKSKCDEQIVGKRAKNTAHQDIGSFLACRAYAQGNHLCPGSKRDDGCSDGPLTNPNDLGQAKSPFHDGWTSHSHGSQTTKGQQDRLPMQTRVRVLLLLTIIIIIVVVCFRLCHTLDRLPICPKEEKSVADKHGQEENPCELSDDT